MMAADSDGYNVTTVVTCEGDIADPEFLGQFEKVLDNLQILVGSKLLVRKLEPWNSVRVTLSIPREAAVRLRHLASEGSQQLRALGILSVQVEGDQVISLRLAGPEPQEIILRTTQQDESSASTSSTNPLPASSHSVSSVPAPSSTLANVPEKIQFRSPNVVCPTDTVVPKVPAQNVAPTSTTVMSNSRTYTTPFPFTSMNQAIRGENVTPSSSHGGSSYNNASTPQLPPPPPPPPYPGRAAPPPITISSPLLVNLLQNDGGGGGNSSSSSIKSSKSDFDSNFSSSNIAVTMANVPTGSGSSNSSTTMLKYSLLSGQESANIKDTTAVMASSYVKRTVQNLKTGVPNGPSNFVNLSNNSSHPSVLSTTSVTQCNFIVTGSSSNVQQNHVLHLPNNNLNNSIQNTASVLSITNNNSAPIANTRPPNNSLQNSNTFQSLKCNNESSSVLNQGISHRISGATVKNQQQCVSSNPLSMVNSSGVINRNALPQTSVNSFNNRASASISASQYSSRSFEPIAQPMPQLVDITPSLTELKSSDLDQLLPSLENDIARSPLNLPEELTSAHDSRCNYLINPLTGELEPHINTDSDNEETIPSDIFTGLPSPVMSSDDDTNPVSRTDTTDQSDSESRSNHSDSSKNSRLKGSRNKERGRDSPSLKPTEKIKLRLKLEKSEPVSTAYKVDVSYINMSANKKNNASLGSTTNTPPIGPGEELRVPPLHISLRGRNHVVINNRKRSKLSGSLVGVDGLSKSSKIKKLLADGSAKIKKNSLLKESLLMGSNIEQSVMSAEDGHSSLATLESPAKNKIKKIKLNHEHREQTLLTGSHMSEKEINRHSNFNSHFKERRGSDSELAHSIKRYTEINGISSGDKKRRLSHTDQQTADVESQLFVLGSTNVGTVAALPTQKLRKDKIKLKDSKTKELNRNKSYVKNMVEKLKQTSLPTAGDMDMEAKFKQRLLEDLVKGSGVSQQLHRIENSIQEPPPVPIQYSHNNEVVEELVKTLTTTDDPPPLKDKPPELAKIDDRKPDLVEKQVGRSPNSGGQGEDSGIESMDALSEKSPNQASQSPHTDLSSETVKSKPQVPNSILDIEAQLAKMEGLNGEDVNENKHDNKIKVQQCCGGLTSALQDSLKQGVVVSISPRVTSTLKEELPQVEENLLQLKSSPKNDTGVDPQPIRVSPPLFTYSNTEKARDLESPISDSDSNSCGQHLILKNKSLLEQLLIDIPDNQNSSSISPVTRSLRSRASSKLSSPELNSPVAPPKPSRIPIAKRKRRESDSSNNSIEDSRNKKSRKCSENAVEMIKVCMGVDQAVKSSQESNNTRKKLGEDSSDSDEPLVLLAGKVRKKDIDDNPVQSTFKASTTASSFVDSVKTAPVKTRSSIRTTPALNTRSKGDKVQTNAGVLRRKTRSTVTDVDGKRRKDVK